jgi:hypothetical protein
MTPKQRELRQEAIRTATAALVGHPGFELFMHSIREMREVAIEDACTDSVVADARASMAAIGEIRAFKAIIDSYDEAKNAPKPDVTVEE